MSTNKKSIVTNYASYCDCNETLEIVRITASTQHDASRTASQTIAVTVKPCPKCIEKQVTSQLADIRNNINQKIKK